MGAVAKGAKSSLRDYDSKIRWGGDEFVVVAEIKDRADLEIVTVRIRANLQRELDKVYAECADIIENKRVERIAKGLDVPVPDKFTITCAALFFDPEDIMKPQIDRSPYLAISAREMERADEILASMTSGGPSRAPVGVSSELAPPHLPAAAP